MREAAVRCPICKRYFCRECVTEHDERLLCARCLKALAQGSAHEGSRLAAAKWAAAGLCGLLLAWLFFCAIGQVLLQIPAEVHEGTRWLPR